MVLLVMWAAATINFVVPKLTPKNPIREKIMQAGGGGGQGNRDITQLLEAYERKFGLDQPIWKQYLTYMNDLIHLDLGYSIANYPVRVSTLLGQALPWTIGLMGVATLIAFTAGSLLGALMAWPKSPKILNWLSTPLMAFSAMPYYLLALILIYILAVQLKLFPIWGGVEVGVVYPDRWSYVKDIIRHAILPSLSIIIVALGGWALTMRGMMVTTQGEDYMINAEAKGLTGRRRFLRYGLRNAMLPQVTTLALSLALLISGSVLVETAFGYPGLGGLLARSVRTLDYFVIYGIALILVLGIGVATLIIDLILPLLDPRVRYEDG
jgi:peptide/nickel transport system permease protein